MLNDIINVDLHIHSKISEYKEAKKGKSGETIVSNSTVDKIDILLKKLNDNNINLFAFSDHNRFDSNLFKSTKQIIDNKKWENIKNIVASVEFDVIITSGQGPCHIITIFDVENDYQSDYIEKCISEFQLNKPCESYLIDDFEKLIKKIGLNTIFIAAQRKSLDNPSGSDRSLSDSVDDVYEFLKVGFISALEFQKIKVEGILMDNLKDFPKEIGLVCGSDCHQWEYYPKHDELSENDDKKFYFSIKALPTFKGLLLSLTSPKTRFRRNIRSVNYLKSFESKNGTIKLDSGITAIIGENGSGKTTLLNLLSKNKLEPTQTKIININGLFCEDNTLKTKLVMQNELIEKNKEESIFGESYFENVDNTLFSKKVKIYAEGIYNFIRYNIDKRNLYEKFKNKTLPFKEDLYFRTTYYQQINISDLIIEENIYKERLNKLNQLLNLIKTELLMNGYTEQQKIMLKEVLSLVKKIRDEIVIKYKSKYLELECKNIIIDRAKSYNSSVRNKSATDDVESHQYKNEFTAFVDCIKEYYNKYVKNENIFPEFTKENLIGISEKKTNGYNFIKTSMYHNNNELEKSLLEKIFNKDFQSIDAIKNINTEDLFNEAVSGPKRNKVKDNFDKSVDNYIAEMSKCTYEVVNGVSFEKMGSTLGEKSLVYYKFLTNDANDFDVLFIDQPEDNISNFKISQELISYFNELRDKKQIIFVTHNPLLVVNLDVDNVIILKNKNLNLEINAGCLEEDGILESISNIMDGGREVIEKRLKLYYGE